MIREALAVSDVVLDIGCSYHYVNSKMIYFLSFSFNFDIVNHNKTIKEHTKVSI